MIRDKLAGKNLGLDKYFRWRGGEISRIESFSDAVFAFAVTLLVVSLEVPKSFDELMAIVKGFLSFGICFTLLIVIWYKHYLYFRRYGINNKYVLVLNSILLFVMIFYIYPLKFLFTLLINSIFNLNSGSSGIVIYANQMSTLMIVYAIGFLLTFLIFFLLYIYAYGKRDELELNHAEIIRTRSEINESIIYMSVPLLSIVLAMIGPEGLLALSGFIYFALGPLLATNGIIMGKKMSKSIQSNDSDTAE